ncbi:Tensin-2 [Varanus komodoensis]|nr:Tensin-2 [Varanus komodoensis]
MGCTVSLVCCEEGPRPVPSRRPGRERGAPPARRAPQLRGPEDLEASTSHTFKVKSFKKVKPCGICRQAITREGSTCRGCKLSCHKKCEAKVRATPSYYFCLTTTLRPCALVRFDAET